MHAMYTGRRGETSGRGDFRRVELAEECSRQFLPMMKYIHGSSCPSWRSYDLPKCRRCGNVPAFFSLLRVSSRWEIGYTLMIRCWWFGAKAPVHDLRAIFFPFFLRVETSSRRKSRRIWVGNTNTGPFVKGKIEIKIVPCEDNSEQSGRRDSLTSAQIKSR